MTKRKSLALVSSALIIVMILMIGIVGCDYKSGDEVGNYFVDVDGEEYNISLLEGGKVNFKVADKNTDGTYKLKDGVINIKLSDKTEIEGTYENETIKIKYNDIDMNFIRIADYTVKFESNGGSEVASVSVRTGRLVPVQKDPTRTQYAFVGWFKDSEFKNAFNFAEDKITADTTLYAKWNYINIVNTVTYKNDDKTSTVNTTKSVVEGSDFILEVPKMSIDYQFIGWFTADGNKITDNKGKSLKVWNPEMGDIEVVPHYAANFNYEVLEDGTVKVSGSRALSSKEELVIPAEFDGKVVSEIGDFTSYEIVKKVTIPATVKKVNEMAFTKSPVIEEYVVSPVEGVEGAYSAKEGVLYADNGATLAKYPIAKDAEEFIVPASVTSIANRAFIGELLEANGSASLGNLKSITFPANLVSIGDYAFTNRVKLATIKFDETSTTELTIGNYAFHNVAFKNFSMPKNVVSIGDCAFSVASTLKAPNKPGFVGGKINLPEGLKVLGSNVFDSIGGVSNKTAYIPGSLTSMGSYVFANGNMFFTKVEFGKDFSLNEIPDGTFYNCGINAIDIPKSVTRIGKKAYGKTKLAEVVLPEGITEVDDGAFSECTSLKSIEFPSTLTTMGGGIFSGCTQITSDKITYKGENNFTQLGDDGVIYSKDGKKIILYPKNKVDANYVVPEGVEEIPAGCFQNNNNLVSIKLPSTLKKIDAQAFSGVSKLEEITIPASVEVISNAAFKTSYALKKVIFEEGSKLTTLGADALSYTGIESIVLPEGITSIDDRMFNTCKELKSITIPSTVEVIGIEVFRNSHEIAEIKVADGNKNFVIENGALYNAAKTELIQVPCKLNATELVVPETVVKVGEFAFDHQVTINKVVLNNVKELGKYAFYNSVVSEMDLSKVESFGTQSCDSTKLTKVDLSSAQQFGLSVFSGSIELTEYVWPKHLTKMPTGIFHYCGFVNITIPEWVTVIGKDAFGFCPKVETVVIPEGVVEIGEKAFENIGTTSDGGVIKSIQLPKSLKKIGARAFAVDNYHKATLTTINIPAGVEEIAADAFDGNILGEFTVDAENKVFKAVDKCLYKIDGDVLVASPFVPEPEEV